MPAMEYMKVETPTQFPMKCICGSSKGPLVDTFIDKAPYEGHIDGGRIYVCRLCASRIGRALGMLKGEEMTRLQNAADELAQAQAEIDERQRQIEKLTGTNGEREAKIQALQEELERRDAAITHLRAFASSTAAAAKDVMVAA